ncbi:acyl-coenzyme A thioesterase 13 isoform X2 [Microcebus murinus]|uniref:acyl-coenzyme A thioesterase 13 isoform X2 n=1 Tax=Microcebus murinus TaxID=30608 RepID=UPI00064388D1|nr:acyl-coenzyme A thioesterase 13 isoform X2 [Microcebus murinus]
MSCMIKTVQEVVKVLANTRGFDRILEKSWKGFRTSILRQTSACSALEEQKVTVVSAVPGKVVCEMKVEEEHTNRMGTLHGGLTATLVDDISTVALLCTERGLPGVSVDMNITYMSPAKIGEDVVITAHILKQGRTLAFASVDLTNKATGKLVAQGRHTKHLGN